MVGLSYIGLVFYASIERLLGEAMSWEWQLPDQTQDIAVVTASTCSLVVSVCDILASIGVAMACLFQRC